MLNSVWSVIDKNAALVGRYVANVTLALTPRTKKAANGGRFSMFKSLIYLVAGEGVEPPTLGL